MNYAKPDLLTPNHPLKPWSLRAYQEKHATLFQKNLGDCKIFDRFLQVYIAITLGSEGMLLAKEGRVEQVIPTAAQEVLMFQERVIL